jgi:hypothetical protein
VLRYTPHPAQCCPLLCDTPQLAESRSFAAPTCNYLHHTGSTRPVEIQLFFFFFLHVTAEKSTESVVEYPSGLGMCACYLSQLGAQTGDCYIQLSVFKDKNMYTNVFQTSIQQFLIFALSKVLVCPSALVLTFRRTRVRFLARTEVLLITKASRNPCILPPGGRV